jgi:probable poly-beta-1,6-N-acetyl-D-glucosamine export protein
MGMSIRLYLWFPLILSAGILLMKKDKVTQKWVLIVICIFYWILLKENNYLVNSIADWLFGTSTLLQKRFFQYSPVFWSIYFVCGAVVWFNYENFKAGVLKYWKKIVLVYIPLVVYMYYVQICNKLPEYFPRIVSEHALYILYMVLTIVVIYIVSLKISENAGRLRGWISGLGSLSYGAYLVHVIVLQHTAEFIRKTIPIESYLLSGLIIFAATCIISFVICYIISFMPLSKYIIGLKTRSLPFIGYGKRLENKTSGV